MTQAPASPPDARPLFRLASVIPVLTIATIDEAVTLAQALVAGGLPVLEVTLRTPVALDAIKHIAAEVPDAVVGAGTVLSVADAEKALIAGASFMVSPGTTEILARTMALMPVPSLPGCATVSEAMVLAQMGFRVLKFFPAEASGGVAWLKSVAGPLPQLKFCPTGGIDAAKAPHYLGLDNVIGIGGSWMAPAGLVKAGDFAAVTAHAREAAALAPTRG